MVRERLMGRYYAARVQLKQEWDQLGQLRAEAVLNHRQHGGKDENGTANGNQRESSPDGGQHPHKRQKLMDGQPDDHNDHYVNGNGNGNNDEGTTANGTSTVMDEYHAIMKLQMEQEWRREQRLTEDPYAVYPDTCQVWSVLPAGVSKLAADEIKDDLERMLGRGRQHQQQPRGDEHRANGSGAAPRAATA